MNITTDATKALEGGAVKLERAESKYFGLIRLDRWQFTDRILYTASIPIGGWVIQVCAQRNEKAPFLEEK